MTGGSLTKLGAVLVVAGALLMAGPIFGFSTLAADRGVNVGTAATDSALLAIEETGETPDNQNDAVVINITNNANERFDPLDAQADIVEDTGNALAISNGFDTALDPGVTTGLELTCSGGANNAEATIEVTADATGSSLEITGVTYTHTFTYSCTGSGGGPTADSGGPYTTYEGESVQLDGTGSSTSTGNIQDYTWELVDGDGTLENAGSAEPTYVAPNVLSENTSITVELTVTDNKGNTDTDEATITVYEESYKSLTADFTYSRTGNGNSKNVELDGTSSIAPDGTIDTYEWDIGNDGTIDHTGETVNKADIPSDTATDVTLTVTTLSGETDSVTIEVQ